MKTLYNYINNLHKTIIDCHVHLFNNDKIISYPHQTDGMIVMVENSIKYPNIQLFPAFDKFISNGIKSGQRLLCVGCDYDDTYNIYKKYHEYISGFGEIKCYKHCIDSEGNELEKFDTSILDGILKMNTGLPIFIHWDLNRKHNNELVEYLEKYPDQKFVLCHCGINELDDHDDAFRQAVILQTRHTNLWMSISWIALDYFSKHMNQLSFIAIPDHTIVGTDINPEEPTGNHMDSRYHKFLEIYERFDVPVALNNLFQ